MKFFSLIALIGAMSSTSALRLTESKFDGELPVQFDASKGGDAFMGNLIKEYATQDDKGVFYINKANALKYATEVMVNDVGMHTFWAKLHIDDNFNKCW